MLRVLTINSQQLINSIFYNIQHYIHDILYCITLCVYTVTVCHCICANKLLLHCKVSQLIVDCSVLIFFIKLQKHENTKLQIVDFKQRFLIQFCDHKHSTRFVLFKN